MATVFVSHSSVDRELVESRIIAPLNARGVRTWYSRDDIATASEWEASIRRALEDCDWFLVAVSPAAIGSRWVKTEVSWALQRRHERVIPVMVRPCDVTELHLQLGLIQHLDFIADEREGLPRLLDRLSAHRASEPGSAQAAADDAEGTIEHLRQIRDSGDASRAVEVFVGLGHHDPRVCTRAQQALHAIGFGKAVDALASLARGTGSASVVQTLPGFDKLTATPELVAALGRLVDAAKGELRLRLIDLADRKRLSLEKDTVTALFRQHYPSYEVVKALGQGLFTAAYLSRHRDTDLEAVVRVLRPELALQPRVRAAFLDATRRAMRYVHQNLAMTRDMGHFANEGVYFVLRDFIPGVTLRKMLEQGKAFTARQIVGIAQSVVEALRPIHARGEAHGGVKPSNIFLTADERVLLGDPEPPASVVGAGSERLGYDYRYAAPETLTPEQELAPHCDMYALGCVLYELACGHPPYESANPFELVTMHLGGQPPSLAACRLPDPGRELIGGLLARRADERLSETDTVLGLLRRCLEDAPIGDEGPPRLFDRDARKVMDAETSVLMLGNPGDVYGTMVFPADAPKAPPAGPARAGAPEPEPPVGRLRPGQQLGKYRIEALVGKGGLGSVYRATHLVLQRTVALKVVPGLGGNVGERFRREMRVHARITHPNVVGVFDAEEIDGAFAIVMEFVEGKELTDLVRLKGALPIAVATAIIRQAASGLSYIHGQQVVHRDIKPSNLMLTRDGVVKILDLGLASLHETASDANVTSQGMILGTPAFMSPEQARGERAGPPSDLYNLGATLFYLLRGKAPFEGAPIEVIHAHVSSKPPMISSLRPDVPPELDRVLQTLLAKSSQERPQSADEVVRLLEPFASGARLDGLW